MDGKELLTELMRVAGENPNSLADKLKNRSLQSQIQRFLRGGTKEPRRTTLQPVADHYSINVEALYDEKVADQVAQARGLVNGPARGEPVATLPHHAAEKQAPYLPPAPSANELAQAVALIGRNLMALDPVVRKPVADTLRALLDHPGEGDYYAELIRAMMTVKQNRAA